MHRHPMAAAMVEQWRAGKLDLEVLAEAASSTRWAYDALCEIAPDRAAAIPPPKRPRGRDPHANVIRNLDIYHAVQSLIDRGFSQRDACRSVARDYLTITPEAVRAILSKRAHVTYWLNKPWGICLARRHANDLA